MPLADVQLVEYELCPQRLDHGDVQLCVMLAAPIPHPDVEYTPAVLLVVVV